MASTGLSDSALSVFAFALYHQFESGEPVTAVIRKDAAGHQASDSAVEELKQQGLADVQDDKIVFTDRGQEVLGRLVEAVRQGASNSS